MTDRGPATTGSGVEGGPRRILSLSAAALVVLVAEPLYLLVDTAVVGRLGAVDPAALAVGAVVLAQISSLGTFLAYGTTARAFGAGDRDRAVAEGVAATWLALLAGLAVIVVGQGLARPPADLLGSGGTLSGAAVSWMRIALCGAPGILWPWPATAGCVGSARPAPVVVVLAGNGLSAPACPVLVHGAGPVPALGLAGSAVANVGAQDDAALRPRRLPPLIWISLATGWGLAGVWAGLSVFVVGRAVGVGLRVRGDRWLVLGAPLTSPSSGPSSAA